MGYPTLALSVADCQSVALSASGDAVGAGADRSRRKAVRARGIISAADFRQYKSAFIRTLRASSVFDGRRPQPALPLCSVRMSVELHGLRSGG